jgi:hypothetical protein
MKYIIGIVAALILGLIGWFFIAPSLAANSLQAALRTSDVSTINNTVDFPLLRENLRGTIGAALNPQNPVGNAGSMLSSALSGIFLNPLVDQLVTPSGLVTLFQGGMGNFTGQGTTNFRVSSGIQGFNKYAIVLTDLSNPQNTITLVMMPRGLQWKLVGINFAPTAGKR